MINTSCGRDGIDEQHCFFAGHLLNADSSKPLAVECDSMSALGPNRPKVSGFLALKQRMFLKFGVKTAVIHKIFWERLSDAQRDEQVMRLRAQLGYKEGRKRKKVARGLV